MADHIVSKEDLARFKAAQESASRFVTRPGKITKADVAAFFERIKDDPAARAGAQETFSHQGGRWWTFWIAPRDGMPATRRTAVKARRVAPTHAAMTAAAMERIEELEERIAALESEKKKP